MPILLVTDSVKYLTGHPRPSGDFRLLGRDSLDFHQWQYSRPDYYPRVEALGLDGGDSTGRWMLDYPFPYDHPPVQAAARKLASALVRQGPDVSAALTTAAPSDGC